MDKLREQWDRILGWCLIAAGAGALVLGWVGVARTPYPAEQLSFIASGGLGGIFLLGIGALLALTADLRDEWITLDRIGRERAAAASPPAVDRRSDAVPVHHAEVDRVTEAVPEIGDVDLEDDGGATAAERTTVLSGPGTRP